MFSRALLVLLGIGLAAAAANYDYSNQTKIFCYLNATRIYEKMTQYQLESGLNLDLCTHIVYGAARINQYHQIEAFNSELEQDTSNKITLRQLQRLKSMNRNLKTIISVHASHSEYSKMARSEHRGKFVSSVLNFLNKYDFDGVNIDWQYPGRYSDNYDDKENFYSLVKDLKASIRPQAKLVTAVLPATLAALDKGYDYHKDSLMEQVDYWFIMAFEYYNHAFKLIGANAPITGIDANRDVTSTIDYIQSKGKFSRDRLKLILVIPFYGKQYMLRDELERGKSPIGQELTNTYPGPEPDLSYPSICEKIQLNRGDNMWIRSTDPDSKTPYAIKDKQVFLYEDPQSITEKTNLALRKGLGGVMAFSLDVDDYEGTCMDYNSRTSGGHQKFNQPEHSSTYKYPLLQAMHDAVQKGPNSSVANTGSMALLVSLLAVTFFKIHG